MKHLSKEQKEERKNQKAVKVVADKIRTANEKEVNKPKVAEKAAVILEPTVTGKDLKKVKEKKETLKDLKTPIAKMLKDTKKKTPRGPSNVAIAEKLLTDKATDKTILKTFTKIYKDKDPALSTEFIAERTKIYIKIAKKHTAV